MTKEELNKLNIIEQVNYINSELIKGGSLRSISSNLHMSKTTFRDRALTIGYTYNESTKQLTKDNNIKEPKKATKRDMKPVIQNHNKSIISNKDTTKVSVVKKESPPLDLLQELKINLEDVKELLGMKEQIKEVIQNYNKSKSIIDVIKPHELKVDKTLFEGELKGRLIKVYDNVNTDWINFCKANSEYKMQDLYSIALLEFIKKYFS
ncbi:hypothetical protein LGL08_22145 [Clostridium estertheticum]|uniref:hypothetical protein n=1 Tax=Clostridium estertheticum TaxID=238834 RepID=UPI001CF44583|nr:hypothetical protein [Clostridium estertheticum]MCB2309262.1 hypothetical protein [Clostridium estertheticum]MCB2346795.1 hypothetical protein [Clostridium estertheticum]MCB2352227.1 hypothetical protein [Clostridium estertheticum]WAG48534.1 hypothetical protein LL127_23655 [Clostridium estertheticum]